jgi:hypothetical protein
MKVKEIYVSTDIEADGPIPGEYSMLSFGSVALTQDKEILGKFSANLETLPGAKEDPDTMQWWQTQKEAWAEHRKDLQAPKAAMENYLQWLKKLPAESVFLGYPVSFDFMYISWYLLKFTGENPFSFYSLDIKTYAWSILGGPFRSVSKSMMPEEWFDIHKRTHIALDDALEQGFMFCNMLKKHKK